MSTIERERTYTVSDYICDRLAELGAHSIFGVPGDFNLGFLDHIIHHHNLRWIGNANELNASYAADGYARVQGIGAVVTTFGVGELSALNGIAGAYAENVPVVHIVGAPSTELQAAHKKVHHTLGDGDFHHFFRIAREVTCSQTRLSPANATHEIDRVLLDVYTQKLPGYISLSTDIARMPASPPHDALLENLKSHSIPSTTEAFTQALTTFLAHKSVVILADLLVYRFGETRALNTLLTRHQLPYGTLVWGKSLVDESDPHFLGIYAGIASEPQAQYAVENADALISIGVQFTDLTTAGFSQKIDPHKLVNIGVQHSSIGENTYAPLHLHDAIRILDEVLTHVSPTLLRPFSHSEPRISSSQDCASSPTSNSDSLHEENALDTTDTIAQIDTGHTPTVNQESHTAATHQGTLTQTQLWDIVSSTITSNHIVVCDQGTSYSGMTYKHLPQGAMLIGQALWGSIGYALAATLGVGLAAPHKRPILLTGDGAAQLSIQELGVLIEHKIPAIMILVNNQGYTVERAIHGPEQPYNDIVSWDWLQLPYVLNNNHDFIRTYSATTPDELKTSLAAAHAASKHFVIIEAHTDPMDLPSFLLQLATAAQKANE